MWYVRCYTLCLSSFFFFFFFFFFSFFFFFFFVFFFFFFFFFSSRRRHTRCSGVSWARRCVYAHVLTQALHTSNDFPIGFPLKLTALSANFLTKRNCMLVVHLGKFQKIGMAFCEALNLFKLLRVRPSYSHTTLPPHPCGHISACAVSLRRISHDECRIDS